MSNEAVGPKATADTKTKTATTAENPSPKASSTGGSPPAGRSGSPAEVVSPRGNATEDVMMPPTRVQTTTTGDDDGDRSVREAGKQAANREKIPKLLRGIPRWITWHPRDRGLRRDGSRKIDKIPDDPGWARAPAWHSWQTVLELPVIDGGGLGFVFSGGSVSTSGGTLLAFDLDACRTTTTLAPWAEAVIRHCRQSYTEVSPSGTGLRVWVCVKSVPAKWLRTHFAPKGALPQGGGKRVEIQVFGAGRCGFVTVTGDHLPGTSEDVRSIESLDWWGEVFVGTPEEAPAGEHSAALPKGLGAEPTPEEIRSYVVKQRHGQRLLDAEWESLGLQRSSSPGGEAAEEPVTAAAMSNSEAYYRLVKMVLTAARGHGEAAVRFLLRYTAWGLGAREDLDSKYTRESWVRGDVARIAGKSGGLAAGAVKFEALEAPGEEGVPLPPAPESGTSPLAVLAQWRREGPRVHLPTGIEGLDTMTNGGPPLGSRVYVVGAPDAGKTMLVCALVDRMLATGLIEAAGILAIDEDPEGVVTRLLQRRGVTRDECESREPGVLQRAEDLLRTLPLRIYDSTWTIERAAVDLANGTGGTAARQRGRRVLVIDSIQTARSSSEPDDSTGYTMVTARVQAIREAASRYGLLVIATSEMSRAAYRSKNREEQIDDMASAKESGAIEYSAQLLLSCRPVAGVPDTMELRVAKNKYGPRHGGDMPGVFLRLDKASQELTQATQFDELPPSVLAQTAEIQDACKVYEWVAGHPGGTLGEIEKGTGLPRRRVENARRVLGAALEEVLGTTGQGRAKRVFPRGENLPDSVRSFTMAAARQNGGEK